jgi:DNA polymerase III epsilon subunit-like protein
VQLHYLDLETTGTDPYQDGLLTIQTHRIDAGRAVGRLTMHKAWESSERDIVRIFLDETEFFADPWRFVPVGFNLGFEIKWLFVKAKQHGALPRHARFESVDKPRIDLKDIAVMMNGGRFKGSKLENFSTKMGSGDVVAKAVARRDHATIEHYVEQETEAFLRLFEALVTEMPAVWRRVAPRLGVDADDPAPYRRPHDPLAATRDA